MSLCDRVKDTHLQFGGCLFTGEVCIEKAGNLDSCLEDIDRLCASARGQSINIIIQGVRHVA